MIFILVASKMFPPSWDQFIPSIIATFIGFILALIGNYWLETWLEKRKNKKEIKKLFERLKHELSNLKLVLSGLNKYNLEKNPLETPVWNEAINVGLISLIEADFRKKLFTVYKKINELNSWYEIKTNYYFTHPDTPYNKELDTEIEKQINRLINNKQLSTESSESEIITIDIIINCIDEILNKNMNKTNNHN